MFEPFPKIRMKALLAGASLVCFDICSYGRLGALNVWIWVLLLLFFTIYFFLLYVFGVYRLPSLYLCFSSFYSAYEVPAAAAEVPWVPGGRKSLGGFAGPPGRADAAQVQHRSHPRTQRVLFNVTSGL